MRAKRDEPILLDRSALTIRGCMRRGRASGNCYHGSGLYRDCQDTRDHARYPQVRFRSTSASRFAGRTHRV